MKVQILVRLFFLLVFLLSSAHQQAKVQQNSSSLSTAVNLVNQVAHDFPLIATQLQGHSVHLFNEQELLTFIRSVYNRYMGVLTPSNITKLVKAELITIDLLRNYKVSGYSFTVDPNFALIWNNQNPFFTVYYKNDLGKINQRKYQASISSIGFKFEFAIKINFIFFINTDFNFYDSNKIVEFDSGIDFSFGIIDVTYAAFKHMPGGMLIIAYPFPGTSCNLSVVTGGHLTPISW